MATRPPQINSNLSDRERIAILETNQSGMESDIGELKEKKVSKDEFAPVKLITYGLAAIVMTSVAVTLIGHALIK